MKYHVNVIFEKDEHGYFAYCPQLKGCHSQGESFEEANANIREAIELYLETLSFAVPSVGDDTDRNRLG